MRQFPDILPVVSPNQNCENLIGIGGIQVDERRLSAATGRSPFAGNLSADSTALAFMRFRLGGGQCLGCAEGLTNEEGDAN